MPFCIERLRLYYVIPAHRELASLIRGRYKAMDERTNPPFDYIVNNYGCFFSHTFPWLQFHVQGFPVLEEPSGGRDPLIDEDFYNHLNLQIMLVNDFMDCVTIHIEINLDPPQTMRTPRFVSYFLSLFVDDNNNFSDFIQRCIEREFSIHFDNDIIRYAKPYINILLLARYEESQRHDQLRQEAYAISGLREPVINISEYYFQNDLNSHNHFQSWLGPDNYVVPLIYELLVAPDRRFFRINLNNDINTQSNYQLTIRAWGRALTHNGIVVSVNPRNGNENNGDENNQDVIGNFMHYEYHRNHFRRIYDLFRPSISNHFMHYGNYIIRIYNSLGTLITNNLILISMERYIRRELQELDKHTNISKKRIDQLGRLEEVLRAQYEYVTSTVGSVTGHGINKVTIDGLNTISMSLSSRLMMRWQHINALLLKSISLMDTRSIRNNSKYALLLHDRD